MISLPGILKIGVQINNRNPMIDVCLMNPPYAKTVGDGLYVKFINKCCDLATNIISVNPETVFIGHSTGGLAKSSYKRLRNYMDNHYIDIEMIDAKKFDANIKSGICIVHIDNVKTPKIKFNYFGNIKEFEKQEDINTYFNNNYILTFEKCIKNYLAKHSDCVENHMKLTKAYGDFVKVKFKENNPDKSKLYVYFMKPGASFIYMIYKENGKNNLGKVREYNEEDQKTSCAYVNFNINEKHKANNALQYFKTDFVRLCIKFAAISKYTYVNRYQVVPWLDFYKSYTDEELFKMIGMEYDKEEIDKILNK